MAISYFDMVLEAVEELDGDFTSEDVYRKIVKKGRRRIPHRRIISGYLTAYAKELGIIKVGSQNNYRVYRKVEVLPEEEEEGEGEGKDTQQNTQ